jgi:hypothetical protein
VVLAEENEERIVFPAWHLGLMECPRQGFWRLRCRAAEEARAVAARTACAWAVAELARSDWPADWFDRVPLLVSRALIGQWRLAAYDPQQYHLEAARLSGLLRRFLHTWRPPTGVVWRTEPGARWEDRASGIVVVGHLDLLIPREVGASGPAVVLDWRIGESGEAGAEPPADVVALAALAQARLGLQCAVEVRRLHLATGSQASWRFARAELALHWRGIRRLGQGARRDFWPPRPGRACESCYVGNCELRPEATDSLLLHRRASA